VEPTDLVGTWALARRIVDRPRRGGRRRFGRVAGTLTLRRDGAAVDWFEEGTLTWGGHDLAVTRRLRIEPTAAGWEVRFDDGRPFHPWRPGAPVLHPCRDDVYCGLVSVDAAQRELRVLWDVTGPAKDVRLFTRCRRATLGG
jgi:hypothetical protein